MYLDDREIKKPARLKDFMREVGTNDFIRPKGMYGSNASLNSDINSVKSRSRSVTNSSLSSTSIKQGTPQFNQSSQFFYELPENAFNFVED